MEESIARAFAASEFAEEVSDIEVDGHLFAVR
jgi:hypothetical protein